MTAYYNEFEPFPAQWLRNLIKAGLIAPGEVDERSIKEVDPDDIREFTQCHFFAGIGVWSYALREAGWPDDRPVWTGSCPCQPFSAAGQGMGADDERHLWPTWYDLIRALSPERIFGEQVADGDGLDWLDIVYPDLEKACYTMWINDICSAGFGCPGKRQRLYFSAVGNRTSERLEKHQTPGQVAGRKPGRPGPSRRLASTDCSGREQAADGEGEESNAVCPRGGEVSSMAGTHSRKCSRLPNGERRNRNGCDQGRECESTPRDDGIIGDSGISEGQSHPGPVNGFWRDADWLYSTDGKWRPVRPGSFPLATGHPQRVGKIRAYGNAINPEVAKEFIKAAMSVMP